MSTREETKPAGKSKPRKGKDERSKKAAAQTAAPAERQSAEPKRQPRPVRAKSPTEPPPGVVQPAVAAPPEPAPAVASPPPAPIPAAVSVSTEPKPVEIKPAETKTIEAALANASLAESAPVSLQTIASAYRDFTRKSIEDFGSFVEQLSGVRSLDKAMTVHADFVKRAYETSVAESQKIYELHNRLARQTLDPFKRLTGKTPATPRKP